MSVQRGSLLFQTGRHEEAESEFRHALLSDPNDPLAHALLGLCLAQRKEFIEGTREAEEAIRLRPDWDIGYHTLGVILRDRNRLKEAAKAAEEAIRLDPFDPDHQGLLASIRLGQKEWKAALTAADVGLQTDPQHVACINARGIALTNLGRRDEAAATLDGALAKNPENPTSHANRGWALLHAGNPKQALEHFRESLRLDPESKWAKAGIVEALKARNPLYRIMLKYFLFMARLKGRAQWGIIIGAYLGYRGLLQYAEAHPGHSAWVWPVLLSYLCFALLSWLAAPLFNLMLRLDRFGKYALSRTQTVAANWVGSCMLAALLVAIVALLLRDTRLGWVALMIGALALPMAAVFNCPVGWPRWTMAGYTAALALVGLAIFALEYMPARITAGLYLDLEGMESTFIQVYVLGFCLNGWVANALIMARVKK